MYSTPLDHESSDKEGKDGLHKWKYLGVFLPAI